MGSLTLQQEITLIVLGVISAMLSSIGSILIILNIYYRNRRNRNRQSTTTHESSTNNNNDETTAVQKSTTFRAILRRVGGNNTQTNTSRFGATTDHRLLFMMSIYDILLSTLYCLQPFLMDRTGSHFNIGFGNRATCTLAGTLHQISYSGGCYCCMLSYYYLLTVRYGWPQSKIDRSKVEWGMHIISIGIPLITGLSGAIFGFWGNEAFFMGCWVGEYPRGCRDSDGAIPCRNTLILWIIGGSLYVNYIVTVIFTNALIFLYVRKVSMKSLNWSYRHRRPLQMLPAPTANGQRNSVKENQLHTSDAANPSNAIPMTQRASSSEGIGSVARNPQSSPAAVSFQPSSEVVFSRGQTSSSTMWRGHSSLTERVVRSEVEEVYRNRLRRVRMQGVYYLLGGFFVYSPFFISQAILVFLKLDDTDQSRFYSLFIFQSILGPCAGFVNAYIFFRHRFSDIRYNPRTGAVQTSIRDTIRICVFGESRRARFRRLKRQRLQQTETGTSVSTRMKSQKGSMVDSANENARGDLTESTDKVLGIINEEPDNEQLMTMNASKRSSPEIDNRKIAPVDNGDAHSDEDIDDDEFDYDDEIFFDDDIDYENDIDKDRHDNIENMEYTTDLATDSHQQPIESGENLPPHSSRGNVDYQNNQQHQDDELQNNSDSQHHSENDVDDSNMRERRNIPVEDNMRQSITNDPLFVDCWNDDAKNIVITFQKSSSSNYDKSKTDNDNDGGIDSEASSVQNRQKHDIADSST